MKNFDKDDRQSRTELLIGVTVSLIIFFIALRVPFDSDFFWHLNAGKVMVSQKSPLLIDLFSYTRFGESWINHSWLSQIIFYVIFKIFGFAGIMVFVALITSSTMIFIYQAMRGHALLKSFLVIFAVLISAVVWSPRPQIFSLLLFALIYRWINNFDQNLDKKYLFFTGSIFLFWSNLHAGFSIGIAFLGLFIGGKLFDLIVIPGDRKNELFKIKSLIILLIICIFVVCINPNGINTWRVQFDTVSTNTLQNQIDEWASPDFHKIEQQPYLWLWLLFVLFLGVTTYKFRFQEIIPIIFFGGLGFIAKRNYAPFAIVIFPAFSKLLSIFFEQNIKNNPFLNKFRSSTEKLNYYPKPLIQKTINFIIVGIIGFAVMGKIVYLGNDIILKSYEEKLYPAMAMEYIEKNTLPSGNLFNSYEWGGYINWKNKDAKIFVDGRTDLFGDEILTDYVGIINSESNYEELLKKYSINWVFVGRHYPIVDELILNDWENFYQDEFSIILVH